MEADMHNAAGNPPAATVRQDIENVMAVMADFSALIERETAALKDMDFQAVDVLQDDKKALARRYHDCVSALAGRSGDIPALDAAVREKLIRARTDFTILLDDNMRALDAAKAGARRLSDRILEIARKTVVEQRQTQYSSAGQASSYKTATLSLKVDENL